LEEDLVGVQNYYVAVKEDGPHGIVFLRKVLKGSSNRSYGVEVARLAGLPHELIVRAREILKKLEAGHHITMPKDAQSQLSLFTPESKPHPIIEKIREIDINKMTPLEALLFLGEIKNDL